jgi:hypothetical protein
MHIIKTDININISDTVAHFNSNPDEYPSDDSGTRQYLRETDEGWIIKHRELEGATVYGRIAMYPDGCGPDHVWGFDLLQYEDRTRAVWLWCNADPQLIVEDDAYILSEWMDVASPEVKKVYSHALRWLESGHDAVRQAVRQSVYRVLSALLEEENGDE